MTGPEHYREAERLMDLAETVINQGGDAGKLLPAAQIHAILALTAATALPPGPPDSASRSYWTKAVHSL